MENKEDFDRYKIKNRQDVNIHVIKANNMKTILDNLLDIESFSSTPSLLKKKSH